MGLGETMDLEALWAKVAACLAAGYEVDPAWIKETFGFEIGNRIVAANGNDPEDENEPEPEPKPDKRTAGKKKPAAAKKKPDA